MYPDNNYATYRMIAEFAAAIICLVLVWFMSKPYKLTRKVSHLGLPLGFGFLGISFILGGISISKIFPSNDAFWLPSLTKTFAFIFIAVAYFFTTKNSEQKRRAGDITIGILIIALVASILLAFAAPQFALDYIATNQYLRIFNVFCLIYIVIHTLNRHIKNLDPTTIWIPLGFIFLAISQYSLLFWYIDYSFSAFVGALILRFIGLGIFLFVAYRSFYREAG
ncbi:MAG: hypothetical protein ACQCN6_08705 [Candidatus Bathyarchaeia archaeon]|jgi:hypothetical protein